MTTAFGESFADAGRYEVRDVTVFHSIEIATDPAQIGITSTRRTQLDGDQREDPEVPGRQTPPTTAMTMAKAPARP